MRLPLPHSFMRPGVPYFLAVQRAVSDRLSALVRSTGVIVSSLAAASPAFAAGTGMPWETPISQFLNSVTGPVLKAVVICVIMSVGIAFAVSEHGSTLRKLLGIAFGVSIACGAGQWGITFFGFSGGAGF